MGGALQLLRGTLDLLVLKTLAANDELHGFEILDWIRVRTGDRLMVEEGALYPALHRMERQHLLASTWATSEKGRRAKYYRLTEHGLSALAARQSEWAEYVDAVASLGTGPVA